MEVNVNYNSIALKDDKQFISIARKVLGSEFCAAEAESNEAFQSAYKNETNILHKNNAARRAANLVILAALKEFGVTNWRELLANDKKPPQRPQVKPVTDSGVKLKGKKWDGPSIVEMGDEKLKKQRE